MNGIIMTYKKKIGLFAVCLLLSCHTQKRDAMLVQDISPEELKEFRQGQKGILLDVRTPIEVAAGFIKGAKFVDFYGASFEDKSAVFSKEIDIYVYCRSGARSEKAARILATKGYKKVYNLKGGIRAWVAQGFPLEK